VTRLARIIARLTGRAQLDRLAALEEKVGKFGRAQRDDLAAQRQQIDQLLAAVSTRAGVDAIKGIDRRLEAIQTALAQQDRTMADALERAGRFDEQAVDDRRFARRVEQLLRHDRPIIVGPWTGEVGFELLYWVPFVRWAVSRYGLDPARLTVVSRGGVASWYGPLAARYLDVFSFASPAEFRAATEDAKKQRRVGAFDARILERVRATPGLAQAELLHPGMMYRLLNPFFKQIATAARVDAYTDYKRLEPASVPALGDLPTQYVAARFYFSDCFPDTPSNRAFVSSTIDGISRHTPVVLLNAPFEVDDHRDMAHGDVKGGLYGRDGARVISIADRMTPEQNLGVQTAVIAGARSFVGTYGGYSYLAPFLGVSALAFYSDRTFKPHHLHMAQRVFAQLGGATVVPLDVAHLPLIQLAVAGAAPVPAS
jgi:hypothetical protein